MSLLVRLHKLSRIPPGGHQTYVSDEITESWRPLHPLVHSTFEQNNNNNNNFILIFMCLIQTSGL